MTRVSYRCGSRLKPTMRNWLLQQELSHIEAAVLKPGSVTFVFTWGLRLKAESLGGRIVLTELSPCCAVKLDPVHDPAAGLCRRCLKRVARPSGPLNLGYTSVEDIAESYGLDPLSATLVAASLGALIGSLPSLFGLAPPQENALST